MVGTENFAKLAMVRCGCLRTLEEVTGKNWRGTMEATRRKEPIAGTGEGFILMK